MGKTVSIIIVTDNIVRGRADIVMSVSWCVCGCHGVSLNP